MTTFKTDLPLGNERSFSPPRGFELDPIRLPASVNLIALRESFLSEAPFVSSSNRMFWRRMVDGRCFQQLVSASYHIILDCVADNSAVDIKKLNNITNSPLINKMASNLAEMYYVIKLRERELLFLRLPEVLAFMVVSAMRTSNPKHYRLCQSARFREILLDWYCELLGGLRFSNCRTNREWFFAELSDAPILIASHPPSSADGQTRKKPPPGIAVSKHQVALSPLINMYTGDSKAKIAELAVNLSLSYSSSRPLVSLPTSKDLPPIRVRQSTIDYTTMRRTLKQSQAARKKIMTDHRNGIKQMHRDLRKYRVNMEKTLAVLNDTSAENIIASQSLLP